MLRFIGALLVATLAVALVTRERAVWRALGVFVAVIALYLALKLTGVIDAMAPSRNGVF